MIPPPPPPPSLPPPPPPAPPEPPPSVPSDDLTISQDLSLKQSLKTMLENRLQPKTDENDVKFRFYSPLSGDSYQEHSFPLDSPLPPSLFNPDRPTKLVAHGNKGLTDIDLLLAQAYRVAGVDCNLVGVDWRGLDGSAHLRVAQAGVQAGRLVGWLAEHYGLLVKNIHCIGFSYGAHVVANTSKEVAKLGVGRIARITALDPGRHGFNQASSDHIRLCKEDGDLVDVIHTSRIGFIQPLGHLDFFPNGGESQVCEGDGDLVNYCDLQAGGGWEHQRSVQYYQESILGYNKFLSLREESWERFLELEKNKEEGLAGLDDGRGAGQTCEEGQEYACMGEHLCLKGIPKEGKYYLRTNGRKPFSKS